MNSRTGLQTPSGRAEIKQDLQALQEITITEDGRSLAIRSEALGTCGKVFQAAGVALPPTIRGL